MARRHRLSMKADPISLLKAPPTRYWRELSTAMFDVMPAETIAVLPIGAIEQHGPHLPVWVDSCINECLLDRALAALPRGTPVLALPLQAVGKSNEHIAFPGTLSLSYETLSAMLIELGESVHRANIRRLILLNSHGGQPQVMDIVARELRIRHTMLVVNAAWFDMGMPAELFSASECRHGIHGGEVETSLMLHLRPDLVDMRCARDFISLGQEMEADFHLLTPEGRFGFGWQAEDLNPSGACGNAAAADAARGGELAQHLVRTFVDLVSEVARFPLDRLRPSGERLP
jgi:creatinine amidohydrolase